MKISNNLNHPSSHKILTLIQAWLHSPILRLGATGLEEKHWGKDFPRKGHCSTINAVRKIHLKWLHNHKQREFNSFIFVLSYLLITSVYITNFVNGVAVCFENTKKRNLWTLQSAFSLSWYQKLHEWELYKSEQCVQILKNVCQHFCVVNWNNGEQQQKL